MTLSLCLTVKVYNILHLFIVKKILDIIQNSIRFQIFLVFYTQLKSKLISSQSKTNINKYKL